MLPPVASLQELPLSVDLINGGQSLGTMTLINYGAAYTCVEEQSSLAPSDDSEISGTSGTPWWVWLVVGLAGALGLASLLLAAGWWRAHNRRVRHTAGRAAPAAPQVSRACRLP